MNIPSSKLASLIVFLTVFIKNTFACDPCSLNNLFNQEFGSRNRFSLGVQEQYTNLRKGNNQFYSVRDGEIVRGFSTTQISALYSLASTGVGLALNVPFIVRGYDKVSDFKRSFNTDAGIGDGSIIVSLSGKVVDNNSYKLALSVFTGVKLPTGDTGTISALVTDANSTKHHVVTGSGGTSAGRLFAFGTGSVDFPIGMQAQMIADRMLMPVFSQYNFKTEGAYSYKFGNDVSSSISPGYLLFLEDDYTFSGHVMIYGEFKGSDKFKDSREALSAYSNIYVGPHLLFTKDANLSIDFSFLFRTTKEDNSIIAPDVRAKLGIVKSF